MKVRENKFFKAIDFEAVFEAVFDECLNYHSAKISEIVWVTIDDKKYVVEIDGNLLTGLTKVEVFNAKDGKSLDIDHTVLLRWGDVELDKYFNSNFEAIKRTFPYQFEPMPTDGIRIL